MHLSPGRCSIKVLPMVGSPGEIVEVVTKGSLEANV